MNTEKLMSYLENSHDPEKWAFFKELRIGTGFTKDSLQRFDAWAINYLPSKKNVTRCYELKISKSDYYSEVNKFYKKRAGLRLSNEFYFIIPKGLLSSEDMNKSPECGFIEFDEGGAMNVLIEAPFRDVSSPTWLFIASICRKFDKDRLAKYLKQKDDELYTSTFEEVCLRHIERWKNVYIGNKEIPDKIADAISDLLHETRKQVELNKNGGTE